MGQPWTLSLISSSLKPRARLSCDDRYTVPLESIKCHKKGQGPSKGEGPFYGGSVTTGNGDASFANTFLQKALTGNAR